MYLNQCVAQRMLRQIDMHGNLLAESIAHISNDSEIYIGGRREEKIGEAVREWKAVPSGKLGREVVGDILRWVFSPGMLSREPSTSHVILLVQ